MNANDIEKVVAKLIILKETLSKEQIDLDPEFNLFKEKNRLFYETIISGEMNNEIFKRMMTLKRKLEDGEDSYGVDVKFGQYMAEKYVDPLVKSIPPK